jgi:hypothetical protein
MEDCIYIERRYSKEEMLEIQLSEVVARPRYVIPTMKHGNHERECCLTLQT